MTAADTHSITSADVQEHNRHIIRPPKFTWPAIRKYAITRVTSLWVGWDELKQYSWHEVLNPFEPLVEMNLHQWNFSFWDFGHGLGMLWIFVTSLNVSNIAEDLDSTVKDVSWGSHWC